MVVREQGICPASLTWNFCWLNYCMKPPLVSIKYCWCFRNPARKPPGMYKNLVNNGINYLYINWWVDPGFLIHQQYYHSRRNRPNPWPLLWLVPERSTHHAPECKLPRNSKECWWPIHNPKQRPQQAQTTTTTTTNKINKTEAAAVSMCFCCI